MAISSDVGSVSDGASLRPSLNKLCIPNQIAASVSTDMAAMSRLKTMRQHVVLPCPVAFTSVMVLTFSTFFFTVSFSNEGGVDLWQVVVGLL